jgi:hypothetical protein
MKRKLQPNDRVFFSPTRPLLFVSSFFCLLPSPLHRFDYPFNCDATSAYCPSALRLGVVPPPATKKIKEGNETSRTYGYDLYARSSCTHAPTSSRASSPSPS